VPDIVGATPLRNAHCQDRRVRRRCEVKAHHIADRVIGSRSERNPEVLDPPRPQPKARQMRCTLVEELPTRRASSCFDPCVLVQTTPEPQDREGPDRRPYRTSLRRCTTLLKGAAGNSRTLF
jgi:hypothetical protein